MRKISSVQVERMRALKAKGLSNRAIAEKIGCSRQSVDGHLRGRRIKVRVRRRSRASSTNGSARFTTLQGFVDSIRSTERERIKAAILKVMA